MINIKNIFIKIFIMCMGGVMVFSMGGKGYTLSGTESEITVFSLAPEVFRKFLETPVMEVLNTERETLVVQTFSRFNDNFDDIIRTIKIGDSIQSNKEKSGVMRIGTLPIYTEFLEFMERTENIKNILEKNNITEAINDYWLIEAQFPTSVGIPVTIWVRTNLSNYFITIDEMLEDYISNPNGTEFVYRLYTHTQYCERFGLHDGSLKVNGENISKGNYVKFECNAVYLPFRAIVEKLGCIVEWDEQNQRAVFTNDTVQYSLRVNEYPHIVKMDELLKIEPIAPGTAGSSCCIIQDRIIVDEYLAKEIVAILGATIKVDVITSMVEINADF